MLAIQMVFTPNSVWIRQLHLHDHILKLSYFLTLHYLNNSEWYL